MRDGAPGDVRQVDDVAALAALAHPDRVRLMDALAVDGPSTTTQLARRLDVATGSVSHHVKVLLGAGLVQSAPAQNARERRWALVARGMRFSPGQFRGAPAGEAAAMAADGIMLDVEYAKARKFIQEAAEPWDDAAYAGHVWVRATPAELAQLGAELDELLLRWRRRVVDSDGADDRRTVLVIARAFPADP